MALPAGLSMLTLYHALAQLPMMINSMFPDPSLLALSTVSFVLYNLASFLVLMRVSPVTHTVLLAGKRVVTTWLACALAGQMPTTIEIAGMCITTVSVYAFEVAKRKRDKGIFSEEAAEIKSGDKTSEQNLIQQLLRSQKFVGIFTCALTVACFFVAVYVAC
jgi:hypothetical protein